MQKTFSEMKSNVANEVYDTSTSMLNLIGKYLNKRYEDVLRRVNYNAINQDFTVTTIAGQKDYPLNDDFSKVISCIDTTNSRSLTEYDSVTRMYDNSPDSLNTTSTPELYTIIDSVVRVQPSTAVQPSIVSSESSDTTQKVYIKGIVSSSEVTESVILNGTTPATFTKSFSRITSVSLDSNCTGYITVYNGSDTYSIITPGLRISRYRLLRLFPTPTGSYVIALPYMIKQTKLVNDTDYPILDIEEILETGALADAHAYQRRVATANRYESIYESMIANYIWNEANGPNKVTLFQPKPYSRNTTGLISRLDGDNR